jgi:hypothetical protein
MLNNSEFWFIFELMVSILEISAFFYFIHDNSIQRRNRIFTWFTFIIFILIIILANTCNLHILSNSRAIITMSLCFIFYKINYEVNIIKAVAATLIFWMLLISIDSISLVFVKFANSLTDFEPIFKPSIFRLELISITKTLLIFAIIYSKYFKLLNKITTKDFIYLIIPMITNIFSLFLVFGKDIINLPSRFWQDMSFVIISILVILSNIFLVFIILKIIRDNRLIEEQKLQEKTRVMEQNYYIRLEENNYKVRKLYHDMKNHLICIGKLCNSDESRRYVDSLKLELNKLDNVYNTGNRVLDIILNEKSSVCSQRDIKLITYIDFSKSDFMELIDVNTIFSNALDNAIQACDKIDDSSILKKINVKSKYVNDFNIIKITNTKLNNITKKDYKIISDKKDKFLHGFGLINIKETIIKYEGQIIINDLDNEFSLTILIPLQNKKT